VKTKLYLFFLLSLCTLGAKIVNIRSINEAKPYLNKGYLIVFDLDNTIMEPIQELGTDQWFYYYFNKCKNEGLTNDAALYKSLREWSAIQGFTKMQLVESEIKSIIDNLQDQGQTTMGMTTRDLSLCLCTLDQLRVLGVDLNKTAPSKKETYSNHEGSILFRKGVLFTSGTHKGRALLLTLDKLKYKPKGILFINDKKCNIEPVEEECALRGIEFLGLRYGFLDEKVAKFDRNIADIQHKNFGTILSDTKAKELLKH
jgi:hypothetical protein